MVNAVGYASRMMASKLRGTPTLLSASLYPTHRCNLRCTYCNSPFLKTPELTTAQWLAVIDELAHLGCRRVAILGGEPLLRSDVPAMVERARAGGMSVVLTSNGLLVVKQLDRLRQVSTLVLSLDAAGPANDEVRGTGVFQAVREAAAAAREAGLPVKINAVLSASTAPLLDELLMFVEQQDLHVTVNIMRSGNPVLWRNAAAIKAADEEIRRTLERLAVAARSNPRLLFSETTYRYAAMWGDYSRDRYEANELPGDDPRIAHAPRCEAGRYYLTINPDGTVFPCALTVGSIAGGNVVRDGVRTAWQTLHGHRCVACYSPCQVEQNYLYSLRPAVVGRFVTKHLNRFS